MENKIFTSVIILSYNSSKTIAEAIDSVLNQVTEYPFEIIIGDDCSTDNSREICLKYKERYPDKIRLFFHENNMGLVRNWLTLIKEAKGKYITNCAGDDYWHNSNKLQIQVSYLEARPDYALLYTDYDIFNEKTGKLIKNYLTYSGKKCLEGEGLIKKVYQGKVPIAAVTVCFRKDVFDKYIPVQDYISLRFPIEDWPTWLIFSKYCKIGYLSQSTATYRKGHESHSNPLQYEKIEKRFKLEQIMYEYVSKMFPEDLNYDEKNYQNYINSLLLNLSFRKNDYESALKYSGRLLDNDFKNRKVIMARNKIFFRIFVLLQKAKGKFSLILI